MRDFIRFLMEKLDAYAGMHPALNIYLWTVVIVALIVHLLTGG